MAAIEAGRLDHDGRVPVAQERRFSVVQDPTSIRYGIFLPRLAQRFAKRTENICARQIVRTDRRQFFCHELVTRALNLPGFPASESAGNRYVIILFLATSTNSAGTTAPRYNRPAVHDRSLQWLPTWFGCRTSATWPSICLLQTGSRNAAPRPWHKPAGWASHRSTPARKGPRTLASHHEKKIPGL